ncbi:hypothetical protein T484DRAFT_1848776 [Baffinella frigidus]|nr:hypothetical protein T484DRAFT_1848776 [Cryptophyta sp. CCMP2293]
MGITSCLGNTLDDVADSLYNAKSGLRLRTEFADLGIKSHVCGLYHGKSGLRLRTEFADLGINRKAAGSPS